jgi:hypothetical protein
MENLFLVLCYLTFPRWPLEALLELPQTSDFQQLPTSIK